MLEHRVERIAERGVIVIDLDPRRAGRNQHAGIIGRGIAVDRDRVEARADRALQPFRQACAGNPGVGREKDQQCRHVGLDHARTLGNARNRDLPAGCIDACADRLGQRIGGHDTLGRGEPGIHIQRFD